MATVGDNEYVENVPKEWTNEEDFEKVILHDIPLDCVPLFVLRNPGDYCITQMTNGKMHLSVMGERVGEALVHVQPKVVDLCLEMYQDNTVGVRGIPFARADSFKELIVYLCEMPPDIISSIVDTKIVLRRLMTHTALNVYNIFLHRDIQKKVSIATDYEYYTSTGEASFNDGRIQKVTILSPAKELTNVEFYKKIYQEIKIGLFANSKKLPIRTPFAAVLEPPMLIYQIRFTTDEPGFSLDYLLDTNQRYLDLCQRIKICASCVRIMSELHTENLFHGGITAKNFYASIVSEKNNIKQIELIFNGADGLFEIGTKKRTRLVDYDMFAPETAFTRMLTPQTGVYNMGRLFEKVLEPDIVESMKMNGKGHELPGLTRMREIIETTTKAHPVQRPSMHGIIMMIRQVLVDLPPTNSRYNVVHFDQFNN